MIGEILALAFLVSVLAAVILWPINSSSERLNETARPQRQGLRP